MTTEESKDSIISVPDRFENLKRRVSDEQLNTIVVSVDDALHKIDSIYNDMLSAMRGAFLALRGESGAGKSTFLHTIGQFRKSVRTESVPGGADIREFFQVQQSSGSLTVFVLEEREAAVKFTDKEIEDWLHAINGFIRSDRGEKCLVVWPCNTDELLKRVISVARKVGDDALLGIGDGYYNFRGPSQQQFAHIAETTVAVLNQGATFSDLGLSADTIERLSTEAKTIGKFLGLLRSEIQTQKDYAQSLVAQDKAKLWIIVVAGNDPVQEVAALTRGRYSAFDIERLMSSTDANIVKELKPHPEKLGTLASALDAKILHLPVLTALSLARCYADEPLRQRMIAAKLSLKPDNKFDGVARLTSTEMSRIFASGSQGVSATGKKPGSSSAEAFLKLADIARNSDILLNRAIATGLVDGGLITSFDLEQDFGNGLTRRTDIVAKHPNGDIRIEMMWRSKTGRADVANYCLTKLGNYGRALGYL